MTEKFYFILFPSYPTLWLLIQEGASEPINVKGEETEQGKKKQVRKKNHRWIIIGASGSCGCVVSVYTPRGPGEKKHHNSGHLFVIFLAYPLF